MTRAGLHERLFGTEEIIPAVDPPVDRWYFRPGANTNVPELIERVTAKRDLELQRKGFVPADPPASEFEEAIEMLDEHLDPDDDAGPVPVPMSAIEAQAEGDAMEGENV